MLTSISNIFYLIYATKFSLRLLVCLLMYATICAIHSCNGKRRGGKRWWEDIESEIGRRRGTISLEHSRASNHLLERKKKNPKLFTKEKHYIFGIFKSAGNWFDIIRNQILYLKINTEKIHSNRLRNQALYV